MESNMEKLAEQLYEGCSPAGKPSWDQLSDVTKQLWMERAYAQANQQNRSGDPLVVVGDHGTESAHRVA